jgi:N-acetylglucosaminyl-diphospho-decaprenol L-rhamnosyltransferase
LREDSAHGHDHRLISVSLVSHGHAAMVASVLADLRQHRPTGTEVILTLNIAEPLPFDPQSYPFPLRIVRNARPRGFAANHNAAFEVSHGEFFCILNPDIRLTSDPFPPLVEELQDASVGVAAPLILSPEGRIEDSARPFPTLLSLARKALGFEPKRYYEVRDQSISPDWVGGMFMLFRREVFAAVSGFDPAYFLYYEDVDLCARIRLAGYDVRLVPKATAVHDAQRQSRRDIRYSFWHLRSMTRYLLSGLRRSK